MGNKPLKTDRFLNLSFVNVGMEDVNEFCRELKHYNTKICVIRKALHEAEKSLVIYMGLHDITHLHPKAESFKMNVEHVTMALFYSFSAFF